MRAVAVRKFKERPERMELPKPVPGDGEILVHLGAAGVNPYDWKILDGLLDGKMPHVFPLIVGVDGAGAVDAVGPGVTRFAVGDGVFGQFFHAPVGTGTYAEYVVAPESIGIAKRPRGMYNEPAAAVPTPGMTALQALDELGLAKRQTLLVLGAAGGVGSFAVQLAANQGIQTVAASRTPNRDYLLKLGAIRYYESSSKMFHDDVRAAYPNGLDAILDLTNSGPAFEENLDLLRPGGTVASTIGAATEPATAPKGVTGLNIALHPRAELLDRLSAMYTKGQLRIPIEQKSPLDSAADLLDASRQGTLRGKAVLVI
ncbi:MAG TPA: NADP-dependent oxidoreductase [Thermoplasmata archaeon]|jgi:NADPH:quinone reductase-like Zn-dependent oxidoreductase|nr:NADP-dependent oxidoreductase [Thermoplasmata archaeon]